VNKNLPLIKGRFEKMMVQLLVRFFLCGMAILICHANRINV